MGFERTSNESTITTAKGSEITRTHTRTMMMR